MPIGFRKAWPRNFSALQVFFETLVQLSFQALLRHCGDSRKFAR